MEKISSQHLIDNHENNGWHRSTLRKGVLSPSNELSIEFLDWQTRCKDKVMYDPDLPNNVWFKNFDDLVFYELSYTESPGFFILKMTIDWKQ